MLFLYIISLLYLTQVVSSRSLSETDVMNKIIEDMLLKAEKKNAKPIQFSWTDRIRSSNKLSTQRHTETKKAVRNENIFDLHVEPFLRNKPKLNGPPLTLQDIISQINKIQAQTDRHSYMFSDFRTTKDEALHTLVSRKANHSSKARTRYRNKTTRSTEIKQKDSNRIDIITSSASKMLKTVKNLKPLHNDVFYLKKIPFGVIERVPNLRTDAVTTTFETTGGSDDTLDDSQEAILTTGPEYDKLQKEVTDINDANSEFKMKPTVSSDNVNAYASTVKTTNVETEFNMDHVHNVYTPSQNVLAARHQGALHSIEVLLNIVPNYDKTESLDNIMNNIAQEISSVELKDTTDLQHKLKSLDELDAEIGNSPAENARLLQNLFTTKSKELQDINTIEMTEYTTSSISEIPFPHLPLQSLPSKIYSSLPSTDLTLNLSTSTYSSLPYKHFKLKHLTSTFRSLPLIDLSLKHSKSIYSSLPYTDLTSKHLRSTDSSLLSTDFTLKHSTNTYSSLPYTDFTSHHLTSTDSSLPSREFKLKHSTGTYLTSTVRSIPSSDLLKHSESTQRILPSIYHLRSKHSTIYSNSRSTDLTSKHSTSTSRDFLSSMLTLKPATSTTSNTSSSEYISEYSSQSYSSPKYSKGMNEKFTSPEFVSTISDLRSLYSKGTNDKFTSPEFVSEYMTPSDLTSMYSKGTNDKFTFPEFVSEYSTPSDLRSEYSIDDEFTPSEFTSESSILSDLTSKHSQSASKLASADLYLLVRQKDNLLKGYFTIDSNVDRSRHVQVTSPSQDYATLITNDNFDVVSETPLDYWTQASYPTVNSNETADLYKEIMRLYGGNENVKPPTEDKEARPLHKKNTKIINWERIKKFFGHERVCNCKCKENKTICRVCAASDAVIRELTFEFNNLAEYMQRHCTEIQTFFWVNPSGGKKLRDAVHKMDKSMQDYYKRVKGKCSGRTCKTFATYLDKRQKERKRKADLLYLESLLEELSHRSIIKIK